MPLTSQLFKVVKKAAALAGFELIVKKKEPQTVGHESILPLSTYAPWLTDRPYQDMCAAMAGNTLVDNYRCYDLWQIVEQTAKLEGALIEIGVWRGGSGALIAKKARMCSITDKVYLCDTFTGVVKAGQKDSVYVGGEHADTSKDTVEALLGSLGIESAVILTGIFPDETGHIIENEKFRFCHIDVDVYRSASDIMKWIWPRMVTGGIIVFDDYGFRGCDGITRLVNEEKGKKDRLFIHNLNGHALLIKLSDH